MRAQRSSASSTSGLEEELLGIPGYDPFRDSDGFVFDAEAAEDAIGFFATCLHHVKAKFAGKPFVLASWQRSIIANLFGWRDREGQRRYREALIYIPRKNGKTSLTAGIANRILFGDGEQNAEIYMAAADREQAGIIFGIAKQQILWETTLRRLVKVYRKSIVFTSTNSFVQTVSSDVSTKYGFDAHAFVVDELHAQRTRDLVDALATSMGIAHREQHLGVYLTTADTNRESICNDIYNSAKKILEGGWDDPRFLPVIYEAGAEDDWHSEEVWRAANPGLGDILDLENFRREHEKAKQSLSFEVTFKRFHLNMILNQAKSWLKMEDWNACMEKSINPENLSGIKCWGGIDLSSTTDLAAFVIAFEVGDRIFALPFFWVPREGMPKRTTKERAPIMRWVGQGYISATDGQVIDYDVILAEVVRIAKKFHVKEIAVDPWNATQFSTQLSAAGVKTILFDQKIGNLNEPTKEFERLVISRKLAHDGNPVMRWMASNVAVKIDDRENIRPIKKASTDRIDGIVAAIMAVGRMMAARNKPVSVYEKRGIRCL